MSSSAPWIRPPPGNGWRSRKPGAITSRSLTRGLYPSCRSQRIEAGVDPEVARGQLREVTQDLRFGQLRSRGGSAGAAPRHLGRRKVVVRELAAAATGLRLSKMSFIRRSAPRRAGRRPRVCGARSLRRAARRRVPRSRGRGRSRDGLRSRGRRGSRPPRRPTRTANSLDARSGNTGSAPPPSSARCAYAERLMQVSPTSRSPCGPSQDRWTRPGEASSVWFVVMFDVAFSRRMCCSRVCRVRT